MLVMRNSAWCALTNSKIRSVLLWSPVRTRPLLFLGFLALRAAARSHAANVATRLVRRWSARLFDDPCLDHPGSPSSGSTAPTARTDVQVPPACGLVGRARSAFS